MVPGIKKAAYRVDKANWNIYSGLSAASLALNGDGLPAVSFRAAITVTSIAGHTECAGSVTVGAETKTFTVSGQRLTTTILLTALPAITSSGLDCQVLIEAITGSGAPIQKETLTNILVGFKATQKTYLDSQGNFTLCTAVAKTTNTSCVAGGIIRVDGIDYTIVQVEPKNKPSGREYMRKLILKQ